MISDLLNRILDLNIDTVFSKTRRILAFFMYFASQYSEALEVRVVNFFSFYVRYDVNLLNVYACVYIYIYIYIHIYIHTCIHTYVRTCIHTYLPTYLSTYIYTYEGWNFNSGNCLFTTDTK